MERAWHNHMHLTASLQLLQPYSQTLKDSAADACVQAVPTDQTDLEQHPRLHFVLALAVMLMQLIIQFCMFHSCTVFWMRCQTGLLRRGPSVCMVEI